MSEAVRDKNRVPVALLESPAGLTLPWKADHSTGYALLSTSTSSSTPSGHAIAPRDGNRVPTALLEDPDGNPITWVADADGNAFIDIEVA